MVIKVITQVELGSCIPSTQCVLFIKHRQNTFLCKLFIISLSMLHLIQWPVYVLCTWKYLIPNFHDPNVFILLLNLDSYTKPNVC